MKTRVPKIAPDACPSARVRRGSGARTDAEAILRALRKALIEREVDRALDRLLRRGRFRAVYR